MVEDWSTCPASRGFFWLEWTQLQGRLTAAPSTRWRGDGRDGAGLFTEVHSRRRSDKAHKLKQEIPDGC